MGRKKQKPEDSEKRLLILKMAEKMFMKQSYSGVSMDALAEAVPVSKRTLYNHFKDKESLFTAVMLSRCQLLFGKFEKTLKDRKTVEQTLHTIGHQYLSVVMEQDALNIYRIAITETVKFPALGQLFYELGPKRSKTMLAEYLQRLSDKGELNVPNAELAAGMFLNMLTGRLHMARLLGVKKKATAKEKDELVKYAVHIFLRGHQH